MLLIKINHKAFIESHTKNKQNQIMGKLWNKYLKHVLKKCSCKLVPTEKGGKLIPLNSN